jgi:Zn-dependent peptidase ImmA (M78 family)/transcriptional regulator with XRE-family HTH domain
VSVRKKANAAHTLTFLNPLYLENERRVCTFGLIIAPRITIIKPLPSIKTAMIGQRIYQARKAAGLTLVELGEKLGVSHTAIQKFEQGRLTPSSTQILALAQACGVRSEYFFRTHTINLEHPEFRKKARFSNADQEKVLFQAAAHAEQWIKLLNIYPSPPIYPFLIPDELPKIIETFDQIEVVVEVLRNFWQLGMDEIPDICDTLEAHGLIVILIGETNPSFDGLVAKVRTNGDSTYPLIAVSKHWPADRQRFTLVHELGHLVLSGRLAEGMDEEKACNRFAGAFLAPKPSVIQSLGQQRKGLEWHELYTLKREYGLSMAGWLMRAFQCEVISDKAYKSLFAKFAKRGWRTKEPGEPLPTEQPKLFEQLVFRALGEYCITESTAAEFLGIPLMTFFRQRQLHTADDAAHK